MGPNEKRELLERIRGAVVSFDEKGSAQLCNRVLAEELDPQEAVLEGLAGGMTEVGHLYQSGQYFVTELLLCADAFYAGLDVLQPCLRSTAQRKFGRVLLGVVQGDPHDIGKNLVKGMLVAAGWEVLDLGKDVSCDQYLAANEEFHADIVGLSALMTTSMIAMPEVIGKLHGAFPEVKVMVGGAPLTLQVAEEYGADGYAPDAVMAVQEAKRLVTNSRMNVSTPQSKDTGRPK